MAFQDARIYKQVPEYFSDKQNVYFHVILAVETRGVGQRMERLTVNKFVDKHCSTLYPLGLNAGLLASNLIEEIKISFCLNLAAILACGECNHISTQNPRNGALFSPIE